MAKKIEKYVTVPKCNHLCIASLTTTIHVVVPLLKMMALMGTVNLITEERSFLALSENDEDDFYLGDIRVRVVDLIESLDENEISAKDYIFNVYIVTQFLPDIIPDKYLILSGREYFRRQFDSVDKKSAQIFSVVNFTQHTPTDRATIRNIKFTNEEFIKLPSVAYFEPYLYRIIALRDVKTNPPGQIIDLITTILEGHEDLTKKDIRDCLRKVGF